MGGFATGQFIVALPGGGGHQTRETLVFELVTGFFFIPVKVIGDGPKETFRQVTISF